MCASAAGRSPADAAPTAEITDAAASVSVDGVRSSLRSLRGTATADVVVRTDASPLGPHSAVPVLDYAVTPGEWVASLIELVGAPRTAAVGHAGDLHLDVDALTAVVTWPDGLVTSSRLTDPRHATTANR